ncbi:YdiU family protein [Shimazuella sp. AN120528]|uniref:protein adenylyltransferase SelO n=1 Tax=Shimazuella soli TaxID=1892854 RepID=UPI001F0D09A8|nr:YdiU family protein [Shimazuella soli]MCH5584328.1 YdiU family protein [Shimazuella soli]
MTNKGWNLDNSYSRLPNIFFKELQPAPVRSPNLIVLNRPLAASLGLNIGQLESETGVQELVGNRIPEGASPLAQAYAGHQFGHFTMLGDGRAILIGEQITPSEERFDIQLKGAGITPYSRGGDGRAALGPMLREYIISEAMHGLGIPTTRSLAVTTTGEPVYRETKLPGAVLTRVASSHIRVGTFQYAANWGSMEELRILADYAIQRHYPEIQDEENRFFAFLQSVMNRQAALIAKWQLAGFVHGVMNTDNMAISGETIDFGPCAFMDIYDPSTVFSSIDRNGRYAYGNQPKIANWNLARFAETLLPLLHDDQEQAIQIAQRVVSNFPELYRHYWLKGMRGKLGLYQEEPQDQSLIEELLKGMEKYRADYTNTFRALTFDNIEGQALFETVEFTAWYAKWHERLEKQHESIDEAQELMKKSNPAVIPRNHRVEEALEAAERGNYDVMNQLIQVLSHPYAHSTEQEEYSLPSDQSTAYVTYCGT